MGLNKTLHLVTFLYFPGGPTTNAFWASIKELKCIILKMLSGLVGACWGQSSSEHRQIFMFGELEQISEDGYIHPLPSWDN